MITYPLNDIEYSAEDAELYACTRTSGVFSGDDFTITCTGDNNNVTVGVGVGWIHNTRFSGKVFANKSPETMSLGVADSTYPRIDVVAIRFDVSANSTSLVVKNGTAAASPVMPEIVQTESVYELYLASVYREAAAVNVTQGDITDHRLDDSLCGIMRDGVTRIPTEGMAAQYYSLLQEMRDALSHVLETGVLTFNGRHGDVLPEAGDYTPELVGAAPAEHEHDAGDITRGTLPVDRGGTGVTENPSMLIDLGSTSAASVFAAKPRPGVTGILPAANGGTGVESLEALAAALGVGEGGGVKIATGSYVGTGTYGSYYPNSVTFDFAPRFFMFIGYEIPNSPAWRHVENAMFLFLDCISTDYTSTVFYTSEGKLQGGTEVKISEDGLTLTWYHGSGASYQNNTSDRTYYWVAIS